MARKGQKHQKKPKSIDEEKPKGSDEEEEKNGKVDDDPEEKIEKAEDDNTEEDIEKSTSGDATEENDETPKDDDIEENNDIPKDDDIEENNETSTSVAKNKKTERGNKKKRKQKGKDIIVEDSEKPTGDDATEENDEKPKDDATEETKENPKDDEKKKQTQRGRKRKQKDNDNDEESTEDEELPPGTLDGPVKILTSKRERVSTDKFLPAGKKVKEAEEEPDYSKGKGTMLKDIPYIKYQISVADTEDLVVLHKLLYRKPGKIFQVKRNIRVFCGYPFDKDSKYYKAAISLSERLVLPGLKYINSILGLEESKDREKMRTDLLDFLKEPKDLEVPLPARATIEPRAKSTRKVPKKRSRTSSRKSSVRKGYVEIEISDSEEDGDEEDGDEEDAEEERPRRTSKKPIKTTTTRGRRKSSKRRSSSDSSDDEPLIKRKREKPSDAELKKFISSILKDADLEEVTMKNIVNQVYEKFSNCDLTSRKEFIKKTVKDIL